MMLKGHSTIKRLLKYGTQYIDAIYPTIQKVSEQRNGLDVYTNQFHQLIASDTIDAVITAATDELSIIGIRAIAHVAKPGDLIRFTNGSSQYREIKVWDYKYTTFPTTIDPDRFYLSEPIPAGELVAGNTFDILRPSQPMVDSSGRVITTIATDYLTPTGDVSLVDLAAVPITNAAYTDLITLASNIGKVHIENQSGFNFDLRVNAADVMKLPKGFSDFIDFEYVIASVIRAQSIGPNADSGQLTINCFGN